MVRLIVTSRNYKDLGCFPCTNRSAVFRNSLCEDGSANPRTACQTGFFHTPGRALGILALTIPTDSFFWHFVCTSLFCKIRLSKRARHLAHQPILFCYLPTGF